MVCTKRLKFLRQIREIKFPLVSGMTNIYITTPIGINYYHFLRVNW